ncbi:MAG: hypothetical protein M1829_001640 [Trizodia sp. TS-e1964]|nr:MAG: hypothetical protein M1829_001640 [Trizodia sp. TS-e1964]
MSTYEELLPEEATNHTPSPEITKEYVAPLSLSVKVRPTQTEFSIYKELACHYSQFFRNACYGKTTVAPGNINLPKEQPETFQYLVQWMTRNTLDDDTTVTGHASWGELIRLYGLADRLEMLELKNAITFKSLEKALIPQDPKMEGNLTKEILNLNGKVLSLLVDQTQENDILRSLFADILASCYPRQQMVQCAHSRPVELLVSTLTASSFFFRDKVRGPGQGDMCKLYHRHDENTPVNQDCKKFQYSTQYYHYGSEAKWTLNLRLQDASN